MTGWFLRRARARRDEDQWIIDTIDWIDEMRSMVLPAQKPRPRPYAHAGVTADLAEAGSQA